MTTAITLDVLPARFGDCLLVECHRTDGPPWRALVDGGPPDCWPQLQARLLEIPENDRRLDLVVVSHIDNDHIAGLIRLFEDFQHAVPGLTVGDVWFNGLPQLPDPETGTSRSVAQGMQLMDVLRRPGAGAPLPWNEAFGRAAVMTDDAGFAERVMPGGPTLTVLSPTPKRLTILSRVWARALDQVDRGESSEEPLPPLPLPRLTDLAGLAASTTPKDAAAPNGSSIAFLLEHRGASCLLAADAFPAVLGAALFELAGQRQQSSVPVDVFKLPHHGSRANVTSKLVELAPASDYVVSTNGDRFNHPDDEALARVVTGRDEDITLWFNYRNARTERWGDPALRRRHSFCAQYPPDGTAGLRLELPARP